MLKILDKINFFLILLLVFLVPLVFWPSLFNAFSLPKIVLFRSLVLLLLFFSVFKLFLEKKFSSPCQSAYVPRSSANKRILNSFIIDRKLLLFLTFLFLGISASAFFSHNFLNSFWGSFNRHLGLYTYFGFFLFFLLLLYNLKNWGEVKKIIWATLISCFLVSIYALLQYYGLDFFSWNENPGLTGRAFASLGQPNFLGHFLAINIPLAVYAFFYLARKKRAKAFCLAILILEILALFSTLSRAAWLALIAGGVMTFFIYKLSEKKYKTVIWGGGILAVLFLAVISGAYFFAPDSSRVVDKANFQNRLASLVDFSQGSGKMRLEYWQAGLKDFREASFKTKFLGHGPDNLKNVFARLYERNWGAHETVNTYPDRAHNLFLDTLLQFGFLGIILFSLFLGYIFYKTLRFLFTEPNWNRKTYALVFTLFISSLIYVLNNLLSFSSPGAYIYFYLYLALICLIIFSWGDKREKKICRINLSPVSRVLILVFLGIFSLTTIFFYNLNLIRADYAYAQGLRAAKIGPKNCPAVLNHLDQAIRLSPNNTFYKREFLRYSLNCYPVFKNLEKEEIWREEALDTINSVSPAEKDYLFKLYEGRVYSLLSQKSPVYYKQAESLYEELLAFNPYLTHPYKELGRLYLQRGRVEKARKYLNKGVERLPSPNNKYLNSEHRRELEAEIGSFKRLIKIANP